MRRTHPLLSCGLLAAVALPATALAPAGCATLGALGGGGGGTVTSEQLAQRNQALDDALGSRAGCGPERKLSDAGLLAVTATPDGKVHVEAVQWLGSEQSKQCLLQEAAKIALPPWSGPPVSDVWRISTREREAPAAVAELPSGMRDKLAAYMAQANETQTGPITACAQRNLPNEAYARVTYRVFIFPEGNVAGVTPLSVRGEGRDVGFLSCARDFVKEWKFDPFGTQGFAMTDISIQRGADATIR